MAQPGGGPQPSLGSRRDTAADCGFRITYRIRNPAGQERRSQRWRPCQFCSQGSCGHSTLLFPHRLGGQMVWGTRAWRGEGGGGGGRHQDHSPLSPVMSHHRCESWYCSACPAVCTRRYRVGAKTARLLQVYSC